MREQELEESIQQLVESTAVGKDIIIDFKGDPQNIAVELTFSGGWVVKQTILPGKPLVMTKGEPGHLRGVTITINPYEGLS